MHIDTPAEIITTLESVSPNSIADETIYYEPNLKVKALSTAKNIYTGQKNIQIATPHLQPGNVK